MSKAELAPVIYFLALVLCVTLAFLLTARVKGWTDNPTEDNHNGTSSKGSQAADSEL